MRTTLAARAAGLCIALIGHNLSGGPVPANKPEHYPDWWFEQDVIPRLNPSNPTPSWPIDYPSPDDYAAANIGQAKNIANRAALSLETNLPTGITPQIYEMVEAWSSPNLARDDFSALNQGQLKNIAKPFYDQFLTAGYSLPNIPISQNYPWTTGISDDDNYAIANLGQLKYTFSFDAGNLTNSLLIKSGDEQSAASGQTLAQPLTVRVVNRRGQAKPGVPVTFQISQGAGSLSQASVITNIDGEASTQLTILGQSGDTVAVLTQITTDTETFTAHVTPSPAQTNGSGSPPTALPPSSPNHGGSPTTLQLDAGPMALVPPHSLYVNSRIRHDSEGTQLPEDPTDVTLHWSYNGPQDISGFIIEMRESAGDWNIIASPGLGADHHHTSNLATNTRYEFRIFSKRNYFKSAASTSAAWYVKENYSIEWKGAEARAQKSDVAFKDFGEEPSQYYLTSFTKWDYGSLDELSATRRMGEELYTKQPTPNTEEGKLDAEILYSYTRNYKHWDGHGGVPDSSHWMELQYDWDSQQKVLNSISKFPRYTGGNYETVAYYDTYYNTFPANPSIAGGEFGEEVYAGSETTTSPTRREWAISNSQSEHPPGVNWTTKNLSVLYTTDAFKTDTAASIPSYANASTRISNFSGEIKLGADYFPSQPGATHQMSINEDSFIIGNATYHLKRNYTTKTQGILTWAEVWTKHDMDDDADDHMEPSERMLFERTLSWNPVAATQSTEYETKAAEKEEDGYYSLVRLNAQLEIPAPAGQYDPKEKSDGLPIYRNISDSDDISIEDALDSLFLIESNRTGIDFRKITYPSITIPDALYKLTWSGGSRYRVYGYDFNIGWYVMSSGETFDTEVNAFEDRPPKPMHIAIVALDGMADGSDLNLTLSLIRDGKTLTNDSVKFTFMGPQPSGKTLPIDADSSSRFRKVALNGAPLSDSPPEAAPESDQPAEETYIDALKTTLRHSTTDVFSTVPASDLVLSIRRSAASTIWNYRNGLRPHERADLPFGPGWNSSLAPLLRIATEHQEHSTHIYAYVTDESGQTFRFFKQKESWLPIPSSDNDSSTYLTSFDGMIFTRKYGSKIYFSSYPILTQNLPADRWTGAGDPTPTKFYRSTHVVDRLSRSILYEYPNSDAFIPQRIYVAGDESQQLRIRQNAAGKVTHVWDANGNETNYTYTPHTLANGNGTIELLTSVISADGGVTRYTYNLATETDQSPQSEEEPRTIHYHIDIASIENPLGRTHSFAYTPDHTRRLYSTTHGQYTATGLPRLVTAATSAAGTAYFDNQSYLALDLSTPGNPTLTANSIRRTVVTDIRGVSRTYSWDQPLIKEIISVEEPPGQRPRIALFQRMTIQTDGYPAETYIFDPNAGMALKQATDMSGNTSSYAHADHWVAPAIYRQVFPADLAINGYYDDPTSQTDSLGRVTSFTYATGTRIMSSRTDPLGTKTEWTIDTLGRRTEERVLENGVTLVQHTTFDYNHSTFPAFMTRKTVKKLASASATDPSWVADLDVDYVPDASGRLWKEIVDPAGLALTTTHTYFANGSKKTTTDPRGKETKFFYDQRNRLVQINLPDGYNRRFVYDLAGNKIREYDEKGVATLNAYDALNRITTQALDVNDNGQIDDCSTDIVTSYTYTVLGARETVTDPRGTVTKFEYDDLNRLWRKTDDFGPATPPTGPPRLNYVTTYEYDLAKNAGGSTFDSDGWKPTKVIDPRGFTTEITYSKVYLPLEEKVQYSTTGYAVTNKDYDAAGRLTTLTGPARVIVDGTVARPITRTIYDALGRPSSVTEADGTSLAVTTFTAYASTGFAHRVTDALGHVSNTEYDRAGRAVRFTAPAATNVITGLLSAHPVTETRYDAAGNISYTIDPLGRRTDYTYDDRNRRTVTQAPSVIDALTGVASRPTLRTFYDPVGNPIAAQDPLGHVTETEFDVARRPRMVTAPAVPLPNGTTARPATETTYDAAGNILTVKDPKGRVTTNTYDALGRLLTTTDAAGIVTTYAYDAAGNRTDVWDGKNQRTRFTYDGLNRVLATTDPANRAVTFDYDAVQRTARVDSSARRTEYKYDLRGRLSETRYIGRSADDRFYTYDALSRIITVSEPGKSGAADVAYTYDELGRQSSETSSGATHGYAYDLTGNRTQVVYGGGIDTTLVSTYDALNRLSTLVETTTGLAGSRTTTYGYDHANRRVHQQLPSGEIVTTRFDALGRSLGSITTKADGTPVLQLTQAHDLVGNVEHLDENHYGTGALPPRTVVNTYDAANRLLAETSAQGGRVTTSTYGYDAANNRASLSVSVTYRGQVTTTTTTYAYNNLNQLQTVSVTGGAVTAFTYDLDGNRTARATGGETDTVYNYDYENRLIHYEGLFNGWVSYSFVEYTYDYRTRRVRVFAEGGDDNRRIIFSSGLSVGEFDPGSGNSLLVRYVRGSDWGGGVGGLLYSLRDGQPSYKHYNSRGDVVAATDFDGSPTWRASYEAFGRRVSESGTTLDRQKANTKEEDPTGLLNEGFRYRDVETGTFITRDPLGFVDGPNMYAYVVQNPWSKFDPTGLQGASYNRRTQDTNGMKPRGLSFAEVGVSLWSGTSKGMINGAHFLYQASMAGPLPQATMMMSDSVASFDKGMEESRQALNARVDQATSSTGVAVSPTVEGIGEAWAPGLPLVSQASKLNKVARIETKLAQTAADVASEAAEKIPGKSLLPGEGAVGTYDDLIKAGSKGDNITPHHIPSANHMARHGVAKGDGIAINMEHPHPGVGGRHRDTFTYGTQADLNLTPRQALAAGVWDARRIYMQDGLYSPQIRQQLQELIRQNRAANPGLFAK